MSRKHSYEYVKEYIESFGYKLLSKEYKNAHTKLLVQCDKGHKYEVTFFSFKGGKNRNGNRCPECTKHTYEYVKEYIESFGYKLLSNEYKNNHTKLLVKCPNPNHEPYEVTFNNFKCGNKRCPYCYEECRGDKRKLSYNYVKDYIESFDYKLLSNEYKHNQDKILILCTEGHEYETTWNNFQSGARCPICNISKGERKIMDWLEENNIEYIYDKPYFNDLIGIGGGLLRPDFIIEDKRIWIEFDGKFHYEKMYEDDYYERLQIHDEIKNQYAKKNNWKLIRIPYWDFNNIEEILRIKINN